MTKREGLTGGGEKSVQLSRRGALDIETGKPLGQKLYPSYTDVFSRKSAKIAETNEKLVASLRPCPTEPV